MHCRRAAESVVTLLSRWLLVEANTSGIVRVVVDSTLFDLPPDAYASWDARAKAGLLDSLEPQPMPRVMTALAHVLAGIQGTAIAAC